MLNRHSLNAMGRELMKVGSDFEASSEDAGGQQDAQPTPAPVKPKMPTHPGLVLAKGLAAPAAGAVAGGLTAYGANALSKRFRGKPLTQSGLMMAALPVLGASVPMLANVGMTDIRDEMRENAAERRRLKRGG